MPPPAPRSRPNILVTGTPGTGKTTLCEALATTLSMTHVNVGSLVSAKGFHAGTDPVFDAFVLDEAAEERLLDELEPAIATGGQLIDFHTPSLFPERFFAAVLVLRTSTAPLYDRLVARGYPEVKVQENMSAEIMEVVLEEARESYDPEIVHVLKSDTVGDIDDAVARVAGWVVAWMKDRKEQA